MSQFRNRSPPPCRSRFRNRSPPHAGADFGTESAPIPEPIPELEAAPMPEPAPEPAPVGTGDAIPPEGYVYDPEGPLPGLDRLEALQAVTEEDGTVRIFQEPEAKEGG